MDINKSAKKEVISITYQRYVERTKELMRECKKEKDVEEYLKIYKHRNTLLVWNCGIVTVYIVLAIIGIFTNIPTWIIAILAIGIIGLNIWGIYISQEEEKLHKDNKIINCKIEAFKEIVEINDELMNYISIEKEWSIYNISKNTILKGVGIITIVFGIINPILEGIFSSSKIEERVGNFLSSVTLENMATFLPIIINGGVAVFLFCVSIILIVIGLITLVKVYDKIIDFLRITTYGKCVELQKIYILGKIQLK